MKRFATLMLAFALVLGAFSGAQAADIKAKGQWAFDFAWTDSLGFSKSGDNGSDGQDDFSASQRFRTQIDVIASEALKGVVFFEMGNTVWGRAAEGGALGADQTIVEVRRSYIDWIVPNTDLKVRMGIQGLDLPGATFGASPILSGEDGAALTLSYAINDMLGVTALWARPYEGGANETEANGHNRFDEVDVFALAVPVTLDGYKITPYGVYASVGSDADLSVGASADYVAGGMQSLGQYVGGLTGDDTKAYDAWWGGVAFEMSAFAPFSLKADFTYGSKDANEDYATRSGWLVSALAAYKLDMVTPGLVAWYGTGEDDDMSDGSERMPSISPTAWAPTSFGFPGSVYRMDSNLGSTSNGVGSWAIGVQLADISFIENLSHVFRVVYITGTNDSDVVKKNGLAGNLIGDTSNGIFLTEKDHAIEVNFDSTYQIYDNLKMVVEMGWIRADLDDNVWGDPDLSDAKKLAFNFIYDF